MRNVKDMKMMNIRVPSDLKEWLQTKADENHRSLNAEIVVLMEQTRKKEGLEVEDQKAA